MESLVKLNTMSFKSEVKKEILVQGKDKKILNLTKKWMERAQELKYSYHFEWMGRPIIQHPQDMIAAQQLIWDIKPDLIIETGIARGGSLIFYASLLELISQSGVNKNAKVLGIDIDIRKDNLKSIKKHPMIKRINLIEGSSTDRKNSYCVVFDTLIDDFPLVCGKNRPWGKNNNPKSALNKYLKKIRKKPHFDLNKRKIGFKIDSSIDNQILISVSRGGFLKRS